MEILEEKKKEKGLGGFISPHEILGCITEEYDEMKEEVHKNSKLGLFNELMDIMIASYWGLCSISGGTNE